MIEEITSPPFLDDTAQEIVTKLQTIANNINNNAGQVSYSNTSSQLQAETVQTAIDEVKGITDTISSSLTNVSNYSTSDEIAIGTWIDGRTIYRKVYEFSSYIVVSNNWTDTPILVGNIDKIVNFQCLSPTHINYHYFAVTADSTYIQLIQVRSGTNQNVGTLVLEYVKSSS